MPRNFNAINSEPLNEEWLPNFVGDTNNPSIAAVSVTNIGDIVTFTITGSNLGTNNGSVTINQSTYSYAGSVSSWSPTEIALTGFNLFTESNFLGGSVEIVIDFLSPASSVVWQAASIPYVSANNVVTIESYQSTGEPLEIPGLAINNVVLYDENIFDVTAQTFIGSALARLGTNGVFSIIGYEDMPPGDYLLTYLNKWVSYTQGWDNGGTLSLNVPIGPPNNFSFPAQTGAVPGQQYTAESTPIQANHNEAMAFSVTPEPDSVAVYESGTDSWITLPQGEQYEVVSGSGIRLTATAGAADSSYVVSVFGVVATWVINVQSAAPPEYTGSLAETYTSDGTTYTYDMTATDPNGDTVTFSINPATALPPEISFVNGNQLSIVTDSGLRNNEVSTILIDYTDNAYTRTATVTITLEAQAAFNPVVTSNTLATVDGVIDGLIYGSDFTNSGAVLASQYGRDGAALTSAWSDTEVDINAFDLYARHFWFDTITFTLTNSTGGTDTFDYTPTIPAHMATVQFTTSNILGLFGQHLLYDTRLYDETNVVEVAGAVSISSSNGDITITGAADGLYNVRIEAIHHGDDRGWATTDRQSSLVRVGAAPIEYIAPILRQNNLRQLTANTGFQEIQLTAITSQGDSARFSLAAPVSGVSLSTGGLLRIDTNSVPTLSPIAIRLSSVADPTKTSVVTRFTNITQPATSQPPVMLDRIENTQEGTSGGFTLVAVDPEGGQLIFSLNNAPAWITLYGNRLGYNIPVDYLLNGGVTPVVFDVTVTDEQNLSETAIFTINISDAPVVQPHTSSGYYVSEREMLMSHMSGYLGVCDTTTYYSYRDLVIDYCITKAASYGIVVEYKGSTSVLIRDAMGVVKEFNGVPEWVYYYDYFKSLVLSETPC